MELIRRTVIALTTKGQLVLDLFLGSGTTAVVCKLESRSWIGLERDSLFVKVTKQRIAMTKKAR